MKFNPDIFEHISTVDSEMKMPLTPLPLRSTIVNCGHRRVLISPCPKIEEVGVELRTHGSITDIVSPNCFHFLGLKSAARIFPSAQIWFPDGLEKKCKGLNSANVKYLRDWDLSTDLVQISVKGMPKFNESLFYHPKSRTLICADLCFNLRGLSGWGPFLIFSLFGTHNRFGVSRFFLKMITERSHFEDSLDKIFAHDFERIIMAHGEIVQENGKDHLLNAFAERGFATNRFI